MGRRVKKTVYAYGAGGWELQKEILFVYDGWNLVQEKEVSGTGNPLFDKFYVWGLDLSQSIQGAGGIGGLVCRISGGEVRHYFYDANGNVGQLLNPVDGVITARYEYDSFGKAIGADGIDAGGNVFRFSTKYYNQEGNLYYYGYRYYSPGLGRWLARDPITEEGASKIRKAGKAQREHEVILLLFVRNNPVNSIDAKGLWHLKIEWPWEKKEREKREKEHTLQYKAQEKAKEYLSTSEIIRNIAVLRKKHQQNILDTGIETEYGGWFYICKDDGKEILFYEMEDKKPAGSRRMSMQWEPMAPIIEVKGKKYEKYVNVHTHGDEVRLRLSFDDLMPKKLGGVGMPMIVVGYPTQVVVGIKFPWEPIIEILFDSNDRGRSYYVVNPVEPPKWQK